MKKNLKLIFALACSLALALPAFALNKQAVVTSSATTIFTPGPYVHVLVIQNPSTSTGAVSISIDGVNAPTATLGIILQPGQQMIVTYAGGASSAKIVKAILVSGAATLNVSTDETGST